MKKTIASIGIAFTFFVGSFGIANAERPLEDCFVDPLSTNYVQCNSCGMIMGSAGQASHAVLCEDLQKRLEK